MTVIPPPLQSGDYVEIIAPASRSDDATLLSLKNQLKAFGLHVLCSDHIFEASDILCANTDNLRFEGLKQALYDPQVKALFCVRGGYGSMRLIPMLLPLKAPTTPKWLVGLSDITALHLWLNQHWKWGSLHATLNHQHAEESIALTKNYLFGDVSPLKLEGCALNAQAHDTPPISGTLAGGNLSLIAACVGSPCALNATDKIVILEDIGERAYRIDRMLQQLIQSNTLKNARAILLGDFSECLEPNGVSLIPPVLKRFAAEIALPVFQVTGIGHDKLSWPLILGAETRLITNSEEASITLIAN